MCAVQVDHFYTFGDVYEALDACRELEMLLGRLKRQRLLSEDEWAASRENLAAIRARVETHLGGEG
jgi:hypothetical protein